MEGVWPMAEKVSPQGKEQGHLEPRQFLWRVVVEVTGNARQGLNSSPGAWWFRFRARSQIRVTSTLLGWSSEHHTDFFWPRSCTAAVCTYLRYGVFWNKVSQISPTAYVGGWYWEPLTLSQPGDWWQQYTHRTEETRKCGPELGKELQTRSSFQSKGSYSINYFVSGPHLSPNKFQPGYN